MVDVVMAVVGSPWVLPLMFVLCTVDGFFPPVPSESVVIAVVALAVTGHGPPVAVAVGVAAAGALVGDLVSYRIGTRLPLGRLERTGRQRRAVVARARSALRLRGAGFLLAARFVPVGRVVATMTAGATGYPWRRFVAVSLLGAVSWALYSAVLGAGAGAFLHGHPLVAAAGGVVTGLVLGSAVDLVARTRGRTRA